MADMKTKSHRASGGDTAHDIREWLIRETTYSSVAPVPALDSIRLLTGGNMKPVWKFILNCVKKEDFVQTVEQNLSLFSRKPKLHTSLQAASSNIGNSHTHKSLGKSSLTKRAPGSTRFSRSGLPNPSETEGDYSLGSIDQMTNSVEQQALQQREANVNLEKLRLAVSTAEAYLIKQMADLANEEAERSLAKQADEETRLKAVLLNAYTRLSEDTVHFLAICLERLRDSTFSARRATACNHLIGSDASTVLGQGHIQQETSKNKKSQVTERGHAEEGNVDIIADMGNKFILETEQETRIRTACEALSHNFRLRLGLVHPTHSKKPDLESPGQIFGNINDRMGGSDSGRADDSLKGSTPSSIKFVERFEGLHTSSSNMAVKERMHDMLKNPRELLHALAGYAAGSAVSRSSEVEKLIDGADSVKLRSKLEMVSSQDKAGLIPSLHLRQTFGHPDTLLGDAVGHQSKNPRQECLQAHVQKALQVIQEQQDKKAAEDKCAAMIENSEEHMNSTSLQAQVWARERQLAAVQAAQEVLVQEEGRLALELKQRQAVEATLRQKLASIRGLSFRQRQLQELHKHLLHTLKANNVAWEQFSLKAKSRATRDFLSVSINLQNQGTNIHDVLAKERDSFLHIPIGQLPLFLAGNETAEELDVNIRCRHHQEDSSPATKLSSRDETILKVLSGDPSVIPTIHRIAAARHMAMSSSFQTSQFSSSRQSFNSALASITKALAGAEKGRVPSAALLPTLVETLHEKWDLKARHAMWQCVLESAANRVQRGSRETAICRAQVEEQDEASREQILHIKAACAEASKGLEKVQDVQKLVHEWWEQPASLVLDWDKFEGMNVAGWLSTIRSQHSALYDNPNIPTGTA